MCKCVIELDIADDDVRFLLQLLRLFCAHKPTPPDTRWSLLFCCFSIEYLAVMPLVLSKTTTTKSYVSISVAYLLVLIIFHSTVRLFDASDTVHYAATVVTAFTLSVGSTYWTINNNLSIWMNRSFIHRIITAFLMQLKRFVRFASPHTLFSTVGKRNYGRFLCVLCFFFLTLNSIWTVGEMSKTIGLNPNANPERWCCWEMPSQLSWLLSFAAWWLLARWKVPHGSATTLFLTLCAFCL